MDKIKIPYGKSDFAVLRKEKYEYVDKTMYIEKLENYINAIYVRPRRFGKSLFTSMISYYYDIYEKDNYEKLFKGLYIYDNPTENKNNYYVLNFNFSGMNVSSTKTENEIESSFNKRVYTLCKEFIGKYNLDIQLEDNNSASITLLMLLSQFKNLKLENKIYIIIDEYDHFTNGMLEGNVSGFFKSLGQGGFVRAFYEVIKEYTEGTNSVIDRFFATGVAPLTLDSLTSGFNIATNISLLPEFVAMCGFTEEEVKKLVNEAGLNGDIYKELEKNYDGYRFCLDSDEHTFNTTLVMYYLKNYVQFNKAPRDLVDSNLATTGNKIESFINIMNPEKNYEKLVELVTTGKTSGNLVRQFELNSTRFSIDNFLSLLFYQGYITIKDVSFDVDFCIPNYVSENLYASYFEDIIENRDEYNVEVSQIRSAIKAFATTGNIEEITKIVSSFLTHQSVRDKENFNEKTLKYVYSLFLSLSNKFYVYGEFPALQGFVDIFIEKSASSNAKYEAIIELKYFSKEKAKGVNIDRLKLDGVEQMKRYIRDKRIEKRENLKKFVIIFEGFEKYYIYEV